MTTAPKRIESAERFLQEAVYRSRSRQAAVGALAADGAGCGLGTRAEVVLELDERGRALFAELWPDPITEEHLAHVRTVMRAWIRAQDGFDRKRNHFLKAFRQEHGFDRRAYTPELLAAYETGLEAVHAEIAAAQRTAALELLASP